MDDEDLGILVYPKYDVEDQTYDLDIDLRDVSLYEDQGFNGELHGGICVGYESEPETFLDVVYPVLLDRLENDFPDAQLEYTDPDILPR